MFQTASLSGSSGFTGCGIWFVDVVFIEQPFVFQLVAATVHSGEPEIFFEGLVFA